MGCKEGVFLHIENGNEMQYDPYELQCEPMNDNGVSISYSTSSH